METYVDCDIFNGVIDLDEGGFYAEPDPLNLDDLENFED
jgi:hypothetical protein